LVLGTPHNSFASEILAESPAWQVVPALSPLRTALLALASAAIPDDGEDMAAMREALGIERHTQNFIDIVSRAAPHV
jgi:hypothetical protein